MNRRAQQPEAVAADSAAPRLPDLFASVGFLKRLRHDERRATFVFTLYGFLLLVCYYVLKTLREPLLLQNGSAELKSYATAAIAVVLMLVIPVYSALSRRAERRQLLRRITVFFAINLAVFGLLGRLGVDVGFLYYVWVGIFGLVMLAQFWAHAAHVLGIERGQRLFPVLMVGAVAGGLVGPLVHGSLFPQLGAWNLMLLMTGLLLATCACIPPAPLPNTRTDLAPPSPQSGSGSLLGGFAIVLRSPYLLLLASMAVLMNCVNSTGEYLLAELVLGHVEGQLAAGPDLEADVLIGAFYADYYFSVNLLTIVIQLFVVGRLFRWIGVQGALLVLPIVALIGYGLIVFVPVFGLIRAIKIVENSTDYSLMNTARHALYLPLPVDAQYEGKTAVDTFFWRLGDLAQAGLVFLGIYWFGFELRDFAVINVLLVLLWLGIALRTGKGYRRNTELAAGRSWQAAGAVAASVLCLCLLLPMAATAAPRPGDGPAAPVPSAEASDRSTEALLFATAAPLELEIRLNLRELCLHPERRSCGDTPAVLAYTDASGVVHELAAKLRVRGRVRTAACDFPALFVFLGESADAAPLFAGQTMLPLTTHCKRQAGRYEQYTLKEYLAYRIYNELTEKSLRVRLVRITYRDTRRPDKKIRHYGFFTEHFESLAARLRAELAEPDSYFDPLEADAMDLGVLTLFQYMIGNTDWSVIYGHNVVHVRSAGGPLTAVAYDFDYSGLVNAEYAVPPENLPLRRVTQRLFRGFCRDDRDWEALFGLFSGKREAIEALVDEVPGWQDAHRKSMQVYIAGFFKKLESPGKLRRELVEDCRVVATE